MHLIYEKKEWDGQAKDCEFGAASMRDHWASGLADLRRTLAHPDWLALPSGHQTTVTHDVHRAGPQGRDADSPTPGKPRSP